MQKNFLSEKIIHKPSSFKSPMVSIVISNLNGEKHLPECLSALMELDYSLYEVIVVDAASTDNSILIIERDFPMVRLIKKGKIGIGEALNDGISVAKGEFVVFDLNNDDVVDKNWLSRLIKVLLNSPDIGVVCGKRFKYGTNNIIDSAGGKTSLFTGNTPIIGENKQDSVEYSVQKEVDYVGVIVTRRAILDKVGLCDPVYYIYHEDTDFCFRVKRFGYKIVFEPSAFFWHKGSSTVGQGSRMGFYYYYRNKTRFILKNYPLRFMFLALFYSLVLQVIYDLPVLVPPIGKTLARFSPFCKDCTWGKDDLMLIKVRTAAILWNIKNLKNTIEVRYETLQRTRRLSVDPLQETLVS
jgi:GT2 family glycosyltransferase